MTFTYHYNQSFKVKNSRCLLPINYREENCRHLSVNVQNHKETVSKRAPILDEREREREVTQWCPTLCDPVDCSLPGSCAHGIFQASVLEWGAISSSILGEPLSKVASFLGLLSMTRCMLVEDCVCQRQRSLLE